MGKLLDRLKNREAMLRNKPLDEPEVVVVHVPEVEAETGDSSGGMHPYKEAERIRQKGIFSNAAEKMVQGGGIGSSIKSAISESMQAKMMGIKEAFDPMSIARFMTGSTKLAPAIVGKLTGRSQEDMEHFTGMTSSAGSGGKATKIGALEQSNDTVGMLMKIFSFMRDINEKQIKEKEKEDNFREERDSEKARRHKELIDAIKGAKSGKTTGGTETASKESGGGFPWPSLGLGAGGAMAAGIAVIGAMLSYFATGVLSAPAAEGFRKVLQENPMLGAASGDTAFAASILDARGGESLKDWETRQAAMKEALKDAPFFTRTYGYGVDSYLKGKGFSDEDIKKLKFSKQEIEKKDEEAEQKQKDKLAAEFDKKGLTNSSDAELRAKYDQEVSYGHIKEPLAQSIKAELEKRKSKTSSETPAPAAAPASASAEPVPPTPSSSQAVAATNTNLEMKLPSAVDVPPPVQTYTNNISNSESAGSKIPMPSVRNMEDTFQRMILFSTRVV